MRTAKEAAAVAALEEAAALRPAAFSSSLSAEDMALFDLIARNGLEIETFVIDTGMLHAETLALLDAAQARYDRPITVVRPDPGAVAHYVAQNGAHAFYDSVDLRHACCAIRKVEPLNRMLAGKQAWVSGLRRGQGATRTDLAVREADPVRGLTKFAPLAAWSWEEVLDYVEAHGVPINALHAQGYPSIGCAPCTRAVRPGEDPRAGRWWWENGAAKECGLHVRAGAAA